MKQLSRAAIGSPPGARPSKTWSKDSAAAKLLREMLTDGRIQQTDSPKKIWEMDDAFQEYPLPNFCGGLNRMKSEVGFHTRDHVFATDERLASNSTFVTPENKKTKFEPSEVGSAGIELLKNDEHVWRPPQIVANWTDKKLRDSTTVVMMVPGGVADKNTKDVNFTVEDEGLTMVAKAKAPKIMKDVELLHKYCLTENEGEKMEDFVLRKHALKKEISKMQKFSDDDYVLVARIPLGENPMLKKIHNVEPIAKDGSRILMIDLKGPEPDYENLDVKEFKLDG